MKEIETSIRITKLSLPCQIGIRRDERSSPQTVQLDIRGELSNPSVGSDNLKPLVDYGEVIRIATEVAAARPRRLLETLLFEIAEAVLAAQPYLGRLTLSCVKPNKFANCAAVGVTRTFER